MFPVTLLLLLPLFIGFGFIERASSAFKDQNNKLAGAKFGIGGLAFLLAFGKPIFEESNMRSIYRPDRIVFEKEGHLKEIEFSWSLKGTGGSVFLQIGETIEDSDSIPRPIVRKYLK